MSDEEEDVPYEEIDMDITCTSLPDDSLMEPNLQFPKTADSELDAVVIDIDDTDAGPDPPKCDPGNYKPEGNLPLLEYEGESRFCETAVECRTVFNQLINLANNSSKVVYAGFGVKWTSNDPLSHRAGKVTILQLHVPPFNSILVQMNNLTEYPMSLNNFLTHDNILLIGMQSIQNLQRLCKSYRFFDRHEISKNLVDLVDYHNSFNQQPENLTVEQLSEKWLKMGFFQNPKIKASNWGGERISKRQIKFAASEVYAYYRVFSAMKEAEHNLHKYDIVDPIQGSTHTHA